MGLWGRLGKARSATASSPAPREVRQASHQILQSLRAALSGPQRDAILSGSDRSFASACTLPEARALVLTAWRRFREASLQYGGIVQVPEVSEEILVEAAWCFHASGRSTEAILCVERALARSPDDPHALFCAACLHAAAHAYEAAQASARPLLSLAPDYPDAWLTLGQIELAQGSAGAEATARRSVESEPGSARAWCLWARTLKAFGREQEALRAFARARELESESGDDALSSGHLAVALVEAGQYRAALALCEEVLPVAPTPYMSATYAVALLSVGRLREGWRQYEYRWYQEPMLDTRVRYECPLWDGQPLAGKAIMLRSEQGIGDVIQFARYASLLKARGARVLLHVHAGMGKLASRFADVDEVQEQLTLPIEFDYYLHMMSLPRVFGTDLASIPRSVPYLSVDPQATDKWRARIGAAKLRVGVVWAGNPKHIRDRSRSIPLEVLAPLWELAGVRFFSLQKELRDTDAPHMPDSALLEPFGAELEDLVDAAAAIDALDLLITVDTAMSHLAGAMGKPVWLLLPLVADFRWLEEREDSPWYPTMRLIRQRRAGDWIEVIDRVREMLEVVSRGAASMLPPVSPPSQVPRASPAVAPVVAEVVETMAGILQVVPGTDEETSALQRYGEYVPHQLDVVLRLIPMDAWIVEVGSGVGSHAIWLSKVLSEEANIILYESRRLVQRILRQNLEANGVANRVSLPRGRLLADDEWDNGGPTHTIDQLALPRLDLLKLRTRDPAAVLQGSDQTIWRSRPRILISQEHGAWPPDLVQTIRRYSYRTWLLDSPTCRSENFAGIGMAREHAEVRSLLCMPEEREAAATHGLKEVG